MKKNKNYFILIAGIMNSFTALLHAIGGQIDLVSPLQKSDLTNQTKAEWLGVWHIVTILLFTTSFFLIRTFLKDHKNETLRYIGYLYVLFAIPFIVSSLLNGLLAPQWILLLPIGLLTIIGERKYDYTN
ncbi:MAG: hypothetical protein Fur0028_09650 [Bacteroidales bacterium]